MGQRSGMSPEAGLTGSTTVSLRHVGSDVARYPHPTALARHVRKGSIFVILRWLEADGLLIRQQGHYRLTVEVGTNSQ
jgi:hypothetical protein